MTLSTGQKLAGAAVAAALVVGGTVAVVVVPGPSGCLPDPSATIQAGGMFDGHGQCYNFPDGLQISKPVVVENAGINDTATGPTKVPGQQLGWKPVVRITKTSNVTLFNDRLTGLQHKGSVVTVNGAAQAGVKIDGSSNIQVNNVTVTQVSGDGMSLSFQPGEAQNSNITVNNFTATNVGRVGVTVANARDSTLSNVHLSQVTTVGVDFESDGNTIGSQNITFNGLTGDRGILIQGNLFGPINFNNSNFSGDVGLVRYAAASGQPVVFFGGTILLNNRFPGTPPAGVWVSGPGNLYMIGVTLGRQAARAQPTGPAWRAENGAHLSFIHCPPAVMPWGSNDATSTVTITP